ncbi:MAG: ThuA domain-containing protein [Planctomycetota bacterium]|nr:ThuA domain-containing protein [Planctomycetota bacterium]
MIASRVLPSCLLSLLALVSIAKLSPANQTWVTYEGKEGPGKGMHIVLLAGDEEYRSEEALPQLGKILSQRHGFKCTVLFAVDADSGMINPNNQGNIPGTGVLEDADLMIMSWRFRKPTDEQMKPIDAYFKAGKPVIGLRTSTHAFNFGGNSKWKHYSNGYGGEMKEWKDGFGRLVLGEKWISHHGRHKVESTKGLVVKEAAEHPILKGIEDGDVWGPSDVYGVRLPLPGDSKPLILGQVTLRKLKPSADDVLFGMRETDDEKKTGGKNEPMMPVAWTKSYQCPGGKKGMAFTTTLGASTDLLASGTRKMVVNAAYWATGLSDKIPADGCHVELVGEYKPTRFEFRSNDYWKKRNMMPSEHELK